MDSELLEEAQRLVASARALSFPPDELPEAAGAEAVEAEEVTGGAVEELKAELKRLDLNLFQAVKTELGGQCAAATYLTSQRQQMVMASMGELLWTVKDALELARDLEDAPLELLALKALARVHLSRVREPDAPVAALNEATKALELSERLDGHLRPELLFVLGEAQLATGLKSTRTEALREAAETMQKAAEAFKELGDTKWCGRAMLGAALALVNLEDEDQQMEGERLAEDAKDLFHDAGHLDLEVVAMLLIVKCRVTTSGLDCALLSAEDAAEDWKEEGGRPEHVAIALHTAASIYLQLKEGLERAAQYCSEALELFRQREWRRASAAVLQSYSRVECMNQNFEKALKCAKECVLEWREMGDRRAEAEALAYEAEAALGKLNLDEHSLPAEEAQSLAEEGKQCSDQSREIFLDLGDKEGLQIVDEVTYVSTNVAVEKYCEATPPGRTITTLKSDGHGAEEVYGEWIIHRGEEMDPLRVRRLLRDGRCSGPVQYL